MKKIIVLLLISASLSGCATILSGPKTECQKKPQSGQAKRKISPGFFIADLFFLPGAMIVDFATGKIYKKECK